MYGRLTVLFQAILYACLLGRLALPDLATADEWPQWLGPKRNGVWHETNLIRSFPAGGPKVIWRAEVGAGYSGPSVAGDRVFVMDRQLKDADAKPDPQRIETVAGSERVLCLDANNGQQRWVHEYDCEYKISYPNGPRTTPTVDGEFVYCLGAMGDLVCLRVDDGSVVWHCNFMERFEFERPLAWGWAASPLVDGDNLICVVGGKKAGVVAFNKTNGDTVWQAIDAKEIGYASPVRYECDGQRQLIVWYDEAIAGLNPADGRLLWDVPFPEDGPVMRPAVTISHPRLFDDHVLVSDFYHGSAVLRITTHPADAEIVWSTPKGTGMNKESFNTLMAAPVVIDGHIYGIAGNGELRCVLAKDGENVWREFGPNGDRPAMFATTFIVPAGEHSFLYNDQGELIIAKLSPQGYEELDRAKILATTSFARGRDVVWSHPAFAHRRMFARNDKELVCIELGSDTES
jgi:outer membrane protein assembly factor BamB